MNIKFTMLYVVIAVLAGCSAKWSDSKIIKSQEVGNEINAALKNYKIENHSYPQTLDLLVPKYIKEIKLPVAGNNKWGYEVYDNNQHYNLGFKDNNENKPECWYDSKINKWGCDTK